MIIFFPNSGAKSSELGLAQDQLGFQIKSYKTLIFGLFFFKSILSRAMKRDDLEPLTSLKLFLWP
jgi:hypothetical protein